MTNRVAAVRAFIVAMGVTATAFVVRAQAPQSTQPVFRSTSDLVTIDVTVTSSGTPVSGLRAGDFVLTDNGVPQSLEVVALEAVPATVTIIIDINDFMRETIRSFVDDVRKIAAMVRPDDDVRLMAIDTYVRDLVPLRKSSQFPLIDRLGTNGLASSNDAIAAAMMRQHDPNRQHLIIAMTNGADTGSVLDINTLTEIARRSSAPLHVVIADLVLEDVGPPKVYSTRQERGIGSGATRSRFWRPFHDKDYERLGDAAKLTGGEWHWPGLFVSRDATAIFGKLYAIHRRSYRLTYVPKGVERTGWHAVAVTVPKYPSYEIGSRPGYAVETRPPESAADVRGPAPAASLVETISNAYDRDPAEFAAALRQVGDYAAFIRTFEEGENRWPDRPKREVAFVLELSQAALTSGQREAVPAVGRLLNKYRMLVRHPLGPNAFEKFWLWTAVSILESVNAPGMAGAFLKGALERFPNEPRLLLAQAFLLDRRQPFAWGTPGQRNVFVPRVSSGGIAEFFRMAPTGLTVDHVREVSAAYNFAIAERETAAEARVRKALFLLRTGNPSEALALLDAANDPDSDNSLRYYRELFRGRVHTELGSAAEAEAAYRAALALAPQAQSPRVALMALALERGDRDAATKLAHEIETAPNDAWDPWWGYWQGDGRMVTGALATLRAQTR
jgi:VWFA-related protein